MSQPVTRGDVAKGAGLAGLARAGAVIEAVAQPLFVWLFGLSSYGIYVVLWASVNLVSNLVDLSMTVALQRVVPALEDEARVHSAVKFSLLVSVVPAAIIALVVSSNAGSIAALFSAAPADRASLPVAIALFVWALPLWTFIEVATSAARARRAFGPEIRLRILWEQIARIVFAFAFFALGLDSLGLMAAHLCSLALTAALCVPLLSNYYRLKLLVRAPIDRPLARQLLATGLGLLPAAAARRFLIDGSPVALNLMLPGAQGATAAGLFEIARKISTVPLIVRQAFQYVMGPLSSAQARADRKAVAPLYRFACRVSAALVVPLAGLLIFAGPDILSVYRREAAAALPLLYVLVAARAFEAVVGPATTVVEMIGHRALPTLNSLAGTTVWALLAFLLVPRIGAMGMVIAVAAATLVIALAATLELRLSDRLSPFDAKLLRNLVVSLAGLCLMALAASLTGGPLRFALVLALWALTSWSALRFGLVRTDREALGSLAHRLRLV